MYHHFRNFIPMFGATYTDFLSNRALLLMFVMVRKGEGQSSHVLVFLCVNLEWHISVLLGNFTCSFQLIVCETNYKINIFSKFQMLQ